MSISDVKKTAIQYIEELEQIRKKALDLRFNLKDNYNYNIQKDCRIIIFERINRLLIYHNLNMFLFVSHLSSPEYITKLFHTSEIDSIRIASDYITRNRQSLILFFESIIEAYYRDLFQAWNLNCPSSFSKILAVISKKVNIDEQSNWYISNKLLSKIRNTIHNNGLHGHNPEVITYHNQTYYFQTGQPQEAADYETIITMFQDILDFLFYIGQFTQNSSFIEDHVGIDISNNK